MSNSTVAVTVVSRNYFHFAVAMFESLQASNPGLQLVVYLLDDFPSSFEHPVATSHYANGREPLFRIVPAGSIGIENWPRMTFQYTPFELACAVKPFAVNHAIEHYGNKVIYCDSDLLFENSIESVLDQLDRCNVMLVPHLVGCTDESAADSQADQEASYAMIAKSGVFNAGFFAVRSTDESKSFLGWWCDRCRSNCYVSTSDGIFVDQAWLNFAPVLFNGVHIEKAPELNVAYWNLHERDLRSDPKKGWVVGNESRPVAFFHFSGFDIKSPESLSKYDFQQQYSPVKTELATTYGDRLSSKGPTKYSELGCEFDSFEDGLPISPLWREAFRGSAPELADFKDPWEKKYREAMLRTLNKLRNRAITARVPWHLEELDSLNRELKNRLQSQSSIPTEGLVGTLLRKITPRSFKRAA
ncbi:MAG TPA: hypothetical protein DDW52_22665 [Planctomycetaceae bacterium]|nr:hypothetical protein [Planctomycetaceae bacterium]